MSYPKPLSEKTIKRLYREAKLSEEAQVFLHTLFLACANLYGAIEMRSVWGIYLKLEDAPKLRRKDLLTFSSIVRREVQPYYVYEIEELYSDESHSEMNRHIIHRDLIGFGYGKFYLLDTLLEERGDRPYYVPEDLLTFAEPQSSKEKTDLLSFLSKLKATSRACVPKYGPAIPNDHRGKKLSDFSFLNANERFELEWLKKRPAAQAAFLDSVSGTEAEKIVRIYTRENSCGSSNINEAVEYIFDELNECGVELTEAQFKTLTERIIAYHNNCRLWCLGGAKPDELIREHGAPTAISFGPGLQKAFADGTMDKEELCKQIRELGLKVLE